MDPLSILASSITLLGASIHIAESIIAVIGSLRHQSDELLTISNDVVDFSFVLREVQNLSIREERTLTAIQLNQPGRQWSQINTIPAANPQAEAMLKRARDKLSDIKHLVDKAHGAQVSGKVLIVRTKLLLTDRMQTLRKELTDIKLNISAYFSIKGSSYGLASMALVHSLSEQVTSATQELMNHDQAVKTILQQLQARQLTVSHSNRGAAMIFGQSASVIQPAGSAGMDSVSAESRIVNVLPSATNDQQYCNSVFKLDISRFRKNPCTKYCSCQCHRRMRRRSPSIIQRYLGSLFIGYTKLPFWSTDCDQISCTSKSNFSATLTYYFPTWFMKRMLSLVLMTTMLGDLGAVIKLRTVSTNFAMFRLASQGDVKRMRSLLARKADHPSSTFYHGWTPLHYAIARGHAAMCKLLLSQQADPLIEDGDQQSALEWAWTKILGKCYDNVNLLAFQSIFTDRECLEEMGYTFIHKIVLDIVHKDLSQELSVTGPAEINKSDFSGRTPLSWAAQRGDHNAVNILLSYGADPNLATPQRVAPIHFATEARNSSCVEPLLAAGADPHAVDSRCHTSLHYACKSNDDISYITPLIARGANVNARTDYDYTVLITAAYNKRTAMAEYLLNHGADRDINTRGQLGKPALAFAVEHNSHGVLRLLLARGADCTLRFNGGGDGGPTIVHIAAKFADSETLNILTEVGIRGLTEQDLEMTYFDGYSIEEVLTTRIRDGEDPSFTQAFQRFWDSLEAPAELADNPGTENGRDRDNDSDNETWEEARQEWS